MQYVGTILLLAIIIWLLQNYQLLIGIIGVCFLWTVIHIAINSKSRKKSLFSVARAHQKQNKRVLNTFKTSSRIPVATQSRFTSPLALGNKDEIIRDLKKNGGLIIDKPWISMILSGQKTWEMRSRKSNKVGYIALIQKGTKQIFGIARIDGYSDKLTVQELKQSESKHRVPASKYTADDYKWFIAIKLSNVKKLIQTIPYQHKSGAVTWVKLGDQAEVLEQLEKQIGSLSSQSTKQQAQPEQKIASVDQSKQWLEQLIDTMPIQSVAKGKYPVADDGSQFLSDNVFIDGFIHLKKGEHEYCFETYASALSSLRRDKTVEWRCYTRKKIEWKKTAAWSKEMN